MVREGSVGVFGRVMVADPSGVVLEGVAVKGGLVVTGGPMREAGAVGSAAAGKPGVCAMQTPATVTMTATAARPVAVPRGRARRGSK